MKNERIRDVIVNGSLALISKDGTFHPQFGEFKADNSDLKDLTPKRTSLSNIRNGDVINWEVGPSVVVRHVKPEGGKVSIYFCGSRSSEKYCSACFQRQEPIECDYPIKKSKTKFLNLVSDFRRKLKV